jgi:16S rRNA (adenine1518-N6/adenine1519-N6)-dimethyltransferase
MTAPPRANQTASFLRARFREVGIAPKNRHGQNFLVDLNLQRLIVDSARLDPRDVVLEVGTGTGGLTALIAERAAAVVTIELDPQLYQLASEELFGFQNITMLKQDVLKNKNHFDPRVLEAIGERLRLNPGGRLKLVANLPYNIATPVITNLLDCEPPPASMTVTLQKEVADRLIAGPSTKDYGALSIWMQSQCRLQIVRILAPTVFWPRPKVTSAIVHIELDESLRACVQDRTFFHGFVRSMFLHRRKFLRGVLLAAYKDRLDKPQVDRILAQLQLNPEARAEQLDVQTMLALSRVVQVILAESGGGAGG